MNTFRGGRIFVRVHHFLRAMQKEHLSKITFIFYNEATPKFRIAYFSPILGKFPCGALGQIQKSHKVQQRVFQTTHTVGRWVLVTTL